MPLSSSNAVRQLSDGNSQGTVLGQSSSDPIGFYGVAAPVTRTTMQTSAANISLLSVVGSTSGIGFSTVSMFGAYTSTVVNMQSDLAALRTQLVNLGLVA